MKIASLCKWEDLLLQKMSENMPMLSQYEATNNLSKNNTDNDELADVRKALITQRNKYMKLKILYDVVQDCVSPKSDLLDNELKSQVNEILLSHNTAQLTQVENEQFLQLPSQLLGIPSTKTNALSCNDASKLKKCLQTALQQKYTNICKEFEKITGQTIHGATPVTELDFNIDSIDQDLLRLKNELKNQQMKYLKNLLQKQEVLEDIAKLRLERLPAVCNEKVRECRVKMQMNVLRTRIAEEKARVDVFKETSNALTSYQEVLKDIKKQQEECQQEINDLQKLKQQYNQISCKQYDNILKSYIQYKTAIEKMKTMDASLGS